MKNFQCQLLIGGTSTEDDINALKNNTPQVIVGCPGRVHVLRRKHLIIQY